jgi:hypothetical protein
MSQSILIDHSYNAQLNVNFIHLYTHLPHSATSFVIFYSYFFFQIFDFFCELNKNAAMIEHTIELQFTMNDREYNNRNKEQHAHSNENEHKKEKKQQNDYEK